MKSHKILLCSVVCVGLGACAYSGPRQVPRPHIPVGQYTPVNHWEDYLDRNAYKNYEHREPCQEYRRVPRNSEKLSNCWVRKATPQQVVAGQPVVSERRLLPVIHSYTLYFDFDKSNIRAGEREILAQIANEIEKYDPTQITVTGFADRAGSIEYNEKLSQRRATTVAKALQDQNITTEYVEQDARGELEPAVNTPDGVKLQENRRVVVDFRR